MGRQTSTSCAAMTTSRCCRAAPCSATTIIIFWRSPNAVRITWARTNARTRQRLWRVRARQVVLAQGAFERPLVFCNNDRPGVMTGLSRVDLYQPICRVPGRSAVVFTNNDSAYQTALDLSQPVRSRRRCRLPAGRPLARCSAQLAFRFCRACRRDVVGAARQRRTVAIWTGECPNV